MDASSGAKGRLAFLDCARASAALFVVFAHGLQLCVPGFRAWSMANLELGRCGVVFFLLISGFIIPPSLEQGGSLGRFWLRRFFRLFPAYWLSIALAFAYLLCGGKSDWGVAQLDGATWLINLTMIQGFLGGADVWEIFWTLRLELLVYVACSLAFALGLLRRVGWQVGAALLLAYFVFAMSRPLRGKPFPYHEPWLLYLAPLMGLIARRYWSGEVGPKAFYALVIAQPAALILIWVAHLIWLPAEANTPLLWTMLCTWGLAYACFLGLLEARRLRMPAAGLWLGRISYSVYLLHPLVLVLLTPLTLPAWAFLPALLGGTLLLAAASYYAVEAPGIALGRAVERRLFAANHSLVEAHAPVRFSIRETRRPGEPRSRPQGGGRSARSSRSTVSGAPVSTSMWPYTTTRTERR